MTHNEIQHLLGSRQFGKHLFITTLANHGLEGQKIKREKT